MVRADQTFSTTHTSTATAGGNISDQAAKSNLNQNINDSFRNAQGVVSEVQNNGDNAALNNGNTVDATISTVIPGADRRSFSAIGGSTKAA